MFRVSFLLFSAMWLNSVAIAQEAKPPATKSAPTKTPRHLVAPLVIDVDQDEDQYMIELRLVEGKDLLPNDLDSRNGVIIDSAANIYKLFRRSSDKTSAPGAAYVAPSPVATSAADADPANPARAPLPMAPPASAVLPPPAAATRSVTASNPEDDELWQSSSLNVPAITTLAMPRLTLLPNQSATFGLQGGSKLSYLEPAGDGKFQARHIDAALGMKITLVVRPIAGNDDQVEISPLEIEITALDGREPIEGLDLDVGKPIVSTRSLKTTAKMKLGATRLIPIPSSPKTQAVLLMCVKRIQAADTAPQPKQ